MTAGVEKKSFAERTLAFVRNDLYEQQKAVQNELSQVNAWQLQFEKPTSEAFWRSIEQHDRLIVRQTQLELAVRGIEADCYWVARDFYRSEIAALEATLADYYGEEAAKRKFRIDQMQLYLARLS